MPLRAVSVGHSEGLGSWTLSLSQKDTVANNRTWGTNRFRGSDLIDDALNLRSPTAYDASKDANGNDIRVINDKETLAAREMQKQIKDKFSEWTWTDPDRSSRLAQIYNEELNSDRLWQPDGSHLTFPGMNLGLKLRPHQKNGVWRIVRGDGNVLLAHVVGSGKTLEIVAGAMELRRLGKSKKPMAVVPNNRVAGTAEEWLRAYPSANILTIGGEDFTPDQRQQMMARIATGNWDGVIVSGEAFTKVPVSDETFNSFLQAQIREYEGFIRDAKADKSDTKIVKELEKAKKRMEAKIRTKNDDVRRDRAISFEDLGVDSLFVDEADLYKNLQFPTKMTRISGIPNTESQRAFDMYLKTQYLTQRNNGRGVIFATGTPVANSMAEVWTMQRYLQPQYLKEHGLQHFDSWAQTFGEVNPALEMTPDGSGVRVTNKFNKFVNMPELIKGFHQVADVQTAKMLQLPVPKLKGGRPTIVSAKASPAQQAYLKTLAERAKKVKGKKPQKGADNILVIGTDGQKAAVDIRLVDPTQPDHPGSKVNMAVDRIVDTWKKTAEKKSTQIVFLDMSTPQPKGRAKGGFSVYEDMRDKLIRRGIPKNEIAFIQDYKGDEPKEELFAAMNAGKVRVLFGSTQAAGVGVNVQKKLIAQHQLDAPYRPRDVEQREGRILRQGNENPEIEIIRYVTEPSFDARKWDILTGKASYINAFMEGDMTVREMEDISDAELSYGEIAAIASGNPAIREKVMVDTEIRKLDAMRSRYEQQEFAIKRDLQALPGTIKADHLEAKKAQKDLDTRDSSPNEFTIGKKTFKGEDGRKNASAALEALLNTRFNEKGTDFGSQTFAIGNYRGFRLVGIDYTQTDGTRREADILIQGELTYRSLNPSPGTAIQSIEAKVRNIEGVRDNWAHSAKESEKKLADTKAIAGQSFEQGDKLKTLLARQAELEKILQTKEPDASAVGGDTDENADGEIETPGDLAELKAKTLTSSLHGSENGPISEYKPGRGTLKAPERAGGSVKEGWLTSEDEGRPIYSNGHILLEGKAPGPETDTSPAFAKSMRDYLHPETAPQPVTPVAYGAPAEKGAAKSIWLSDGTAVDAKYYDHVLKQYPAATFAVGEVKKSGKVIYAQLDGRNIGIVMPLNFPKGAPDAVKPFLNPTPKEEAQQEARAIAQREEPEEPARFSRQAAFSRNAPGFYSQLERTIAEKMPAKASAAQVLGIVRNPQSGVKPDELKWADFDNWVGKQKSPIAKQDVLNYLKANGVQLQEVTHGTQPEETKEWEQLTKRGQDLNVEWTKVNDAARTDPRQNLNRLVEIEREQAAIHKRLKELTSVKQAAPKFAQYVLPGGKNYRELLITLPPPPNPVSWTQTEADTWVSTGGDTVSGEHGRFEIYDFRKRSKGGFQLYDGTYRDTATFPSLEQAQRAAEQRRTSELTIGDQYHSPHWDEPNVLAHIRLDDRTAPDGKKVLMVEEIQSDWHQEGKRKGYRSEEPSFANLPDGYSVRPSSAEERKRGVRSSWIVVKDNSTIDYVKGNGETRESAVKDALSPGSRLRDDIARIRAAAVPGAPFAKSWPELAFRRALRLAAEEGYDRMAWTRGETQADRYDLSQHLSEIGYEPILDDDDKPTGLFEFYAKDKEGKEVIHEDDINLQRIEDLAGKEIAEKVQGDEGERGLHGPYHDWRVLSGLDLKVGGEGMKGFYDQILPAYANRYAKKWGAKVGETTIEGSSPVHSIDITPAMRASVMQGQPLFARGTAKALTSPSGSGSEYRNGILWVNPQVMQAIQRSVDAPDVAAMYLPKAWAVRLGYSVLGGLREAVANAIAEKGSIVIVSHEPGQSISDSVTRARHELFHQVETWAGPRRGQELLKDPTAQKAADNLDALGYVKTDIPLMFSEIGAHLASGPRGWKTMGLTREEAKALFAKYVSLLDSDDIPKLRHIAPQLNEELNAAKSIANSVSRIRRGLDQPLGGIAAGESEGGLQPGVRPALSRGSTSGSGESGRNPYEERARLVKSLPLAEALDAADATPGQAREMTDEQWKMAAELATARAREKDPGAAQIHPPHSDATKKEVISHLKLIQGIRANAGERGTIASDILTFGVRSTPKALGTVAAVPDLQALGAKSNAVQALQSALEEESDKNFGEKLRTFVTGERDIRIAETNQLRDKLKKLIPNSVEQEALSLLRDFKHKEDELVDFSIGEHELFKDMDPEDRKEAYARMRKIMPAVQAALAPTPQMLEADRELTKYFTEHLAEGRKLGFLDSSISNDEYITHLLQPAELSQKPSLKDRIFRSGKLGPRKFKFAKGRFYPTVLHAVASGLGLRTLNALDALTIYGDKYATTAAYHLFLRAVKDSGAGKWGPTRSRKPGKFPPTGPSWLPNHAFSATMSRSSTQKAKPTSHTKTSTSLLRSKWRCVRYSIRTTCLACRVSRQAGHTRPTSRPWNSGCRYFT